MNQNHSVPHLDLAPKLKRPLSLWNPLDYLRLLYWVFFFPQALRWYEDTFGGGFVLYKRITLAKRWELLRQNTIQRQFFLQGLVLTVVIPLAIEKIAQSTGSSLDGSSLLFSIAIGVVVSVTFCVGLGVAIGTTFGVVFSLCLSLLGSIAFSVASSVALGVVFSTSSSLLGVVAFVLVNGGVIGVALGTALNAVLTVGLSAGRQAVQEIVDETADQKVPENGRDICPLLRVAIIGLILVWLLLKIWTGDIPAIIVRLGQIGIGVSAITVSLAAILRPDNWLFSLAFAWRSQQNKYYQLSHISPIPIPTLSSQLTNWLRHDFEAGIHNCNQLLAYTVQFVPVIQSVNQVLAETPPEEIISRVAYLSDFSYKRRLVYSASATLCTTINLLEETETRLDTPARAAAAGFWYLETRESVKATEAFSVVSSLPYGQEMFTLSEIISVLHNIKELTNITFLNLPALPTESLLRPNTWQAIASLYRIIEDIQLVQRSVSLSTRAFALNRALGELTNILNHADSLPKAERLLILDITHTWKESLLQIAGEVGEISILKPVINPYVIGDPVVGNLFVGREDIIRQLEELWIISYQMQSVVLYGHRRMGKTSILLNITNRLGAGIKVAYVNLQVLGDSPQGVGEVLMAISDEIAVAVNLPPPPDENLQSLPYRTFKRYLKQVVETLHVTSLQGLIIALDEFEKIEELIETGKIPPDFMGFLRGMVQMSNKIAFAFAGLHTLEEMTADYFKPFFASVIPIHVGFQNRAATRQILANRDPDFLLDYTPESLDLIYDLTAGQPYLVQLVGFQLVRRYNDQVFEQGRPRNHVFTVEDVEAVVNDPEFFKGGRYYFDGVWGQAARGAALQQTILRAIAPHPQGLSLDAIAQSLTTNCQNLQATIKNLQRHDVVRETDGRIRIIVELFRRWVEQR